MLGYKYQCKLQAEPTYTVIILPIGVISYTVDITRLISGTYHIQARTYNSVWDGPLTPVSPATVTLAYEHINFKFRV